ncbi:MAG: tetratricopeptide repeat protein [Deltaproteobacteria bacterium]|nr:MAG: tetratricopeptide repeat protein [Deltaproteobacteria bacterium]
MDSSESWEGEDISNSSQHASFSPWVALLAIGAVGLLGAWSPMSPLALDAGDLALGQGRPEDALVQYDRVADATPFQEIERAALRRAARVAAVDLDNPTEARLRLRRLARAFPDESAEALERIGDLWLDESRQPVKAAEAYKRAHEADPTHTDAARRLMKAARAWSDAGQLSRSRTLWEKAATEYPGSRVEGLLGLAEAQLAAGDAQAALTTYEEAAELTADPTLGSYAKLGAAACLERLGNLDGALAELDLADLPEDVFISRRQAMMDRQAETW